jgi:hypothetical protein
VSVQVPTKGSVLLLVAVVQAAKAERQMMREIIRYFFIRTPGYEIK